MPCNNGDTPALAKEKGRPLARVRPDFPTVYPRLTGCSRLCFAAKVPPPLASEGNIRTRRNCFLAYLLAFFSSMRPGRFHCPCIPGMLPRLTVRRYSGVRINRPARHPAIQNWLPPSTRRPRQYTRRATGAQDRHECGVPRRRSWTGKSPGIGGAGYRRVVFCPPCRPAGVRRRPGVSMKAL